MFLTHPYVYNCFRYMSTTLLGVAKEHQSVVAVVGKGHLSGIKKNWQQPVTVGFTLPFLEKFDWYSLSSLYTSIHFLKIAARGSFGNASPKRSPCHQDLFVNRCCSCWSCHHIRCLPCMQKITLLKLTSKANLLQRMLA